MDFILRFSLEEVEAETTKLILHQIYTETQLRNTNLTNRKMENSSLENTVQPFRWGSSPGSIVLL